MRLLAALLIVPALGAPAALRAQPASVAARTTGYATGYVAARPLPRGTVLAAEDMAPAAPNGASRAAAAAPVGAAPVGWTTRRLIAAGEPLRAPAVAPPDAIRSGQPVDVVFSDGAIALRLKGTALNAAALGARVAVRIDARRRLEGVAVGPSTVQLR